MGRTHCGDMRQNTDGVWRGDAQAATSTGHGRDVAVRSSVHVSIAAHSARVRQKIQGLDFDLGKKRKASAIPQPMALMHIVLQRQALPSQKRCFCSCFSLDDAILILILIWEKKKRKASAIPQSLALMPIVLQQHALPSQKGVFDHVFPWINLSVHRPTCLLIIDNGRVAPKGDGLERTGHRRWPCVIQLGLPD